MPDPPQPYLRTVDAGHEKQVGQAEAPGVGWARQTLAAVKSLPASQREVIQLAYFERLSQEDIAARLGMPLATVKGTVANSLQRIADAFDRSAHIGGT